MKKLLIFTVLSFFALGTYAHATAPMQGDTIKGKKVVKTSVKKGMPMTKKKVTTVKTTKKTTKRVEG